MHVIKNIFVLIKYIIFLIKFFIKHGKYVINYTLNSLLLCISFIMSENGKGNFVG